MTTKLYSVSDLSRIASLLYTMGDHDLRTAESRAAHAGRVGELIEGFSAVNVQAWANGESLDEKPLPVPAEVLTISDKPDDIADADELMDMVRHGVFSDDGTDWIDKTGSEELGVTLMASVTFAMLWCVARKMDDAAHDAALSSDGGADAS